MTDIDHIITALRQFNQERDWDQFHNGKDLAIGLSLEASELLECFLWKQPEEASIDDDGQDPEECGEVSRG